jgi:hypothetical protein
MGLRPHPPHRPPNPGDDGASSLLCDPRGPRRKASTPRQPRFHGPGAGRRCRPAPPSWGTTLARPGGRLGPAQARRPVTELRPNPIRSDTSRHGTEGAPAGDSGAARRRPAVFTCRARTRRAETLRTGRLPIPPHEPCSREKALGSRSPRATRSREAGGPDTLHAPAYPACAGPRNTHRHVRRA